MPVQDYSLWSTRRLGDLGRFGRDLDQLVRDKLNQTLSELIVLFIIISQTIRHGFDILNSTFKFDSQKIVKFPSRSLDLWNRIWSVKRKFLKYIQNTIWQSYNILRKIKKLAQQRKWFTMIFCSSSSRRCWLRVWVSNPRLSDSICWISTPVT